MIAIDRVGPAPVGVEGDEGLLLLALARGGALEETHGHVVLLLLSANVLGKDSECQSEEENQFDGFAHHNMKNDFL